MYESKIALRKSEFFFQAWTNLGKLITPYQVDFNPHLLQCLPKNWNPVHFIALYRPEIQSLNSHWNLIIFKKNLSKSCSLRLFASFDTFDSKLTDYVMSTDHLNVRRNRHFDHFLSKMEYFLCFAKSSKIDSS